MFERFSDQARRVVVLSAEQARDLSHDYIGTEHLLLGLIAEGQGPAAQVLTSMGVTVDGVRGQIEAKIGRGKRDPIGHIPFTPRAKKVLQLSFPEAMQLGQSQVGTGHILLAMLTEGSGLASEILAERSAPATTIRELINRDFADDPGITTTAVTEQAAAPRPLHVTWHEVLPLVTAIEQRLSAIEEHLGMRGD
ncbi:MAG TPA: Clp protease N-terminal domain-containing protein [Streptosporangiaceae bacterium]|nr:Clp protease N-terminal domain-containing protein [Streptosporangiaceae bacterium]